MVKKKKKRRSTLKICNTVILIPTSFFTRSKLMESGILSVFSSPLVVFPFVSLPHPPHLNHGLSLLVYCLAQARSRSILQFPGGLYLRILTPVYFAKTKLKARKSSNFVVGIRQYAYEHQGLRKLFLSLPTRTFGQCRSFSFWVVFHFELFSALPCLSWYPLSRSHCHPIDFGLSYMCQVKSRLT